MNRTRLFSVLAALALATLSVGVFGFYALDDSQKPTMAQRGARPRPPGAPTVGQAVPRTPPLKRPRPVAPGRIVVPYPPGYAYPYAGVPLRFWYDYPYPYGYRVPPGYLVASPDTVSGNIRLDVSPKDAAVYVDDYYAGIVDDFDGVFRHLTLTARPHSVEIRKPGFETLVLDVYVQPRQTITFRETIMQSVACNALHPVEKRCARCLLDIRDRIGRNEFPLALTLARSRLSTYGFVRLSSRR